MHILLYLNTNVNMRITNVDITLITDLAVQPFGITRLKPIS